MWMCRHCVSATYPTEGVSQWASGVPHGHHKTTEFLLWRMSSLADSIHSLSVSPLLKKLDVEIQGLWWKSEIQVLG